MNNRLISALITTAGRLCIRSAWVFLPLLFVLPARAVGTLEGVVRSGQGGAPLAGAHVRVEPYGRGGYSDPTGKFRIAGLPAGKAEVRVSFLGYRPSEQSCMIKEGNTTRIDIFLEPAALEAPEYEIVETRDIRKPTDKPVRMEIIPAQAIRNNPGTSITSALNLLSGVNLSSTLGIFSSNTVVTLRGLSGNDQARTLVLLDDIPLNKADAGSVNWNLINRENIERIEVRKGPGSARYGAGAMGGVINIRSKQSSGKISGNLTGDFGTFRTAGCRYQAGGKSGSRDGKGLTWSVNGFYRRSDGYNSEIPEYLEKADTFYVNTYLREISLGMKAGYRFNPLHRVEISVNYFNDKRGRGIAIYEVDGAFERHGTWQESVRYQGKLGAVSYTLLGWNRRENFERLNEYMREAEYNLYEVNSLRTDRGASLHLEWQGTKWMKLSGGVEYQYGSVDGKDIYYTSTDLIANAGRANLSALYLQDEIELAEGKIQISAGLRLNAARFHDGRFLVDNPSYSIQYLTGYQDSLFPSNQWIRPDPKFSVQYRFNPAARIYLSAAQGFRAPNLDDLCRTGRIRNGFKIANPSLRPEVLTNFEAGGDALLFNRVRVAGSVYYSLGKDFMYYVSTGDSVNMGFRKSPVFMKRNISRVDIIGAEADLETSPLPWLSFFANYTFNRSLIASFTPYDTAVDKDLTGKWLTDVPAHKLSAGLTIRHRILNAAIQWKFTGRRYINDENGIDPYLLTDRYPSYQTVGIRIWRTFFGKLTAAVNADNLLDVKFIDDRLQRSPGRMMNMELSFSIN